MKKIFEPEEEKKDKIITIIPHKHKEYWMFENNNKLYNIGPTATVKFKSPLIWGIDKLIVEACKYKNILNYEMGIKLMFSLDFFLNCDVKIEYLDVFFGGWLYKMHPEYFPNVLNEQKVWICPYMNFYFSNPPKTLYVKVEAR